MKRLSTTLHAAMMDGLWEGEIVQFAPGRGPNRLHVVSTPDVALAHTMLPHKATVRAQQVKGFVPFTVPLAEASHLRVNGVPGRNDAAFINHGVNDTHIHAPRRNLVAGRVRTERVLRAMSDLTGNELDEDAIPNGLVQLDPVARRHLIKTCLHSIYFRSAPPSIADAVEHRAAVALAKALLSAKDVGRRQSRAFRIVQRARGEFDAAPTSSVSLGQICNAAGFSPPIVTDAFRNITGTSPIHYAKHLKLARAHRMLRAAVSAETSVKAVALDTGFTELGRFSRHYRQAYGHLPSEAFKNQSR